MQKIHLCSQIKWKMHQGNSWNFTELNFPRKYDACIHQITRLKARLFSYITKSDQHLKNNTVQILSVLKIENVKVCYQHISLTLLMEWTFILKIGTSIYYSDGFCTLKTYVCDFYNLHVHIFICIIFHIHFIGLYSL